MSPLEDRLREALTERASLAPIDPDAWEKTVARSRRRFRSSRFQPGFIIPLAAAAAVVAIVVAAISLTGGPGTLSTPRPGADTTPHSLPSSVPASSVPASSVPTPDPMNTGVLGTAPSGSQSPPHDVNAKFLYHTVPPATAIVGARLTSGSESAEVWVWLGYTGTGSNGARQLNLCWLDDDGRYYGGGTCAPSGPVGSLSDIAGEGTLRIGLAPEDTSSVSVTLPTGATVSATVVSGRGFPGKVWLVNYPSNDAAQISYRNAAGKAVGHRLIPGLLSFLPPGHSSGIPVFGYSGGTVTAYLNSGKLGFWGSTGSTSYARTIGQAPLSAFSGWFDAQAYFGSAPADVARVVLRVPDGQEYGVRTIAAWPGSGIRLWGSITIPGDTQLPQDSTVITYNAAGHILRKVSLGTLTASQIPLY
jgi:hypothetical protein